MNKSCAQLAKEHATLLKMRELAKKSALLDGRVYVLYKLADGAYSYCPKDESFAGKEVEYVFPY